jgi:hypothetical protein
MPNPNGKQPTIVLSGFLDGADAIQPEREVAGRAR